MLDLVPLEIRQCPQWLLWRKVWNPQRKKYDKIPLNAVTGLAADVTDPASWTSCDVAVAQYAQHAAAHSLGGVGFVLGYGSGVVGVDLDDVFTSDGRVLREDLYGLADKLNSYTELSPSGTGLHVLARATFEGGRRFKGIEVYGQGRFFTMTGRAFGAARPLNSGADTVMALVSDIDAARQQAAPVALDWTAPETLGDRALYDMASTADNGSKFLDLWEGRWQAHYASQSEADFALINILGFYTDAPTQIARLWHMSALAQRDKGQRLDYVTGMIARSQDKKVPLVTMPAAPAPMVIPPATDHIATAGPDGIVDAAEVEEARIKSENPFLPPEGFVRDLAEWFYAQSMYPMGEIAMAGALGLMAGLCGRQYQFQKQGLNLYMMVLAETGAGKDSLSLGMSRIFNAVCSPPPAFVPTGGVELGFPAARCFEGPSKITGKGLLRDIAASSSLSLVSVLPEFSQTMSNMSDPRANDGLKDFQQVLLEFYTKSAEGASFGGSKNSDKAKDIDQLSSPSFSMLCEGTPARFYSALSETMVTDGLMSRFIVIEKLGYPDHNPTHTQFATVPDHIKAGVSNIAKSVLQLRQNGDLRIHVRSTPEADAYSEYLRDTYRKRGMAETTEVHKLLWMRAHQNLTRMAALLAIGVDVHQPMITYTHLEWANRIIYRQVMLIVGKFRRGEIGQKSNEDKEQYELLLEFVEKFVNASSESLRGVSAKWQEARSAGLVPYHYLQQRAQGAALFRKDRRGSTIALRACLEAAAKAGALERTRLQGSQGDYFKPHL